MYHNQKKSFSLAIIIPRSERNVLLLFPLTAALLPPCRQLKHKFKGISPERRHQIDQRAGAPLLWRWAERIEVVKLEEMKIPVTP